jgi:hypothetical protein
VTAPRQRALVFEDGAWVNGDGRKRKCRLVTMGDDTCWGFGGKASMWLVSGDVGTDQKIHANQDIGLPSTATMQSLAVGPDGTGWATYGQSLAAESPVGGLLKYTGGKWTQVRTEDGQPVERLGRTVELEVTPDGTVWIVD